MSTNFTRNNNRPPIFKHLGLQGRTGRSIRRQSIRFRYPGFNHSKHSKSKHSKNISKLKLSFYNRKEGIPNKHQ